MTMYVCRDCRRTKPVADEEPSYWSFDLCPRCYEQETLDDREAQEPEKD